MLLDLLGECVFEIIGEVVLGLLSPDWPGVDSDTRSDLYLTSNTNGNGDGHRFPAK